LYTPSRTFWLFLSQIFSRNCSCREMVLKFMLWVAQVLGESMSNKTTAYCDARQRLTCDDIVSVHDTVVTHLESDPPQQSLWYGRSFKVVTKILRTHKLLLTRIITHNALSSTAEDLCGFWCFGALVSGLMVSFRHEDTKHTIPRNEKETGTGQELLCCVSGIHTAK